MHINIILLIPFHCYLLDYQNNETRWFMFSLLRARGCSITQA